MCSWACAKHAHHVARWITPKLWVVLGREGHTNPSHSACGGTEGTGPRTYTESHRKARNIVSATCTATEGSVEVSVKFGGLIELGVNELTMSLCTPCFILSRPIA